MWRTRRKATTRPQAALKQVELFSLSPIFSRINGYSTFFLSGIAAEPSSPAKGRSSKHNYGLLRRKPRDNQVADESASSNDQTRKPNLAQVVLVLWIKSKTWFLVFQLLGTKICMG